MECIFGQETEYTSTARHNNSPSTSNRMFAIGFSALVLRVIALALAWLGAWLIVPFAGIELLVQFLALCCIGRHARNYERLTGKPCLAVARALREQLRADDPKFTADLLPITNLTRCWSQA